MVDTSVFDHGGDQAMTFAVADKMQLGAATPESQAFAKSLAIKLKELAAQQAAGKLAGDNDLYSPSVEAMNNKPMAAELAATKQHVVEAAEAVTPPTPTNNRTL